MMVELPWPMTDPGNVKKAYLIKINEEIQSIITLMCSKRKCIKIIVKIRTKLHFDKSSLLAGLFMKLIMGQSNM
jgi:hypothetical protein